MQGAQHHFRRLSKAMSEPGVIVTFSPLNDECQPLDLANVLLTNRQQPRPVDFTGCQPERRTYAAPDRQRHRR